MVGRQCSAPRAGEARSGQGCGRFGRRRRQAPGQKWGFAAFHVQKGEFSRESSELAPKGESEVRGRQFGKPPPPAAPGQDILHKASSNL
jgi:hypothetical protein